MARVKLAVLLTLTVALVVAATVAGPASGRSRRGATSAGPLASAAVAGGTGAVKGPGLTTPTAGSGKRIKGGTVYFAESPASPPNYIFPMYSAEYCSAYNISQFNVMMYRPLYWYGNNYSPTVDYDESIGRKPVVSGGGRTFTIHLNRFRWSDGEKVTADDLVFWMNMLKAGPATEWCTSVPKLFPYDVVRYRALNPSTFQVTFNKRYNPTWVLYNELSQIYPLPLAWDRAALSTPAPRHLKGSLGGTVKGAGQVYRFLNKQSQDTAGWASSPLWKVVDGPFKLQSFSSDGRVTLVANRAYSGSPKPSIAKLVELPYTSNTALFNEIKASGPSQLTIATLPDSDQPQTSAVAAEGYDINKAASYGINYLVLNQHNPKYGPIFRQLYFRQALQSSVDQPGWIRGILHGTAVPTYGPVPVSPASPLVSVATGENPLPFSPAAAAKLLKDNGWRVLAGGSSYCVKPGSGKGRCGAGITRGEKIAFPINYISGQISVASEMQDLQSNLRKVGIQVSLETHTFNEVADAAVACQPKQSSCNWVAEDYGGWSYIAGTYYPGAAGLFATGAADNFENYSDPGMDRIVSQVLAARTSAQERSAMNRFVRYAALQAPIVYEPTSIGTFGGGAATLVSKKLGGYTANAFGAMTPEYWYLTK